MASLITLIGFQDDYYDFNDDFDDFKFFQVILNVNLNENLNLNDYQHPAPLTSGQQAGQRSLGCAH